MSELHVGQPLFSWRNNGPDNNGHESCTVPVVPTQEAIPEEGGYKKMGKDKQKRRQRDRKR